MVRIICLNLVFRKDYSNVNENLELVPWWFIEVEIVITLKVMQHKNLWLKLIQINGYFQV